MYFATSNISKFNEAKALLAPIEVRRLKLPYPEVQAPVLEDVITYALEWLKERTDENVMIEDSGLFIKALGDFPGVYSAYVFKSVGCAGVLKLMDGVEHRTAQFRSCVGLLIDGKKTILSGLCQGTITDRIRGKGGFGFDPIFIPRGHRKTFAEMGLAKKNELSHRAKAMAKVKKFLVRTKGV